uniref:uncharacterized protein LOC127072767 isoform X2 n=1 Tax=Vespula vulgaris TaxID=7454 RepID=UPI00223B711F|nr:uncharacterized protein LOC127072767 isoform X2 [Vespula vulgaris]
MLNYSRHCRSTRIYSTLCTISTSSKTIFIDAPSISNIRIFLWTIWIYSYIHEWTSSQQSFSGFFSRQLRSSTILVSKTTTRSENRWSFSCSSVLFNWQTHNPFVHRRFKKSVDNEIKNDSGKTGESIAVQSDSSLNDQTMSNFDESPNANIKKIEDKTNQANQIHKESTTSGNLFNLNAEKLNPVHQISPNVQENHNLKNPQESLIKLNLPNIQNIVTDNESSKLENLMDKPNLRNFPDPRPFTAVLTTMSKPTQSNFQKEKLKQNEERDAIIGSAQTKNSDLLIKDHFQQNYPTWSSISNYYQSPLYSNLVFPATEYQPGVYMVSNIMDGCNNEPVKTNVDQQSWSQQQIYQDGTNQATGTILNNGYTYWPQYQQNYLTSYILRYPTVPYYYASSVYPNTYLQFY